MGNTPADELITALTAAARGLLVPSEHDAPLTPFRWTAAEPLTPTALVASLGLPPDTPVATRTLEAFFAPLTRVADWMDTAQRTRARRFARLRDLIARSLTDVVVYRLGSVQITVIIVGRAPCGETLGLRTSLIET